MTCTSKLPLLQNRYTGLPCYHGYKIGTHYFPITMSTKELQSKKNAVLLQVTIVTEEVHSTFINKMLSWLQK